MGRGPIIHDGIQQFARRKEDGIVHIVALEYANGWESVCDLRLMSHTHRIRRRERTASHEAPTCIACIVLYPELKPER